MTTISHQAVSAQCRSANLRVMQEVRAAEEHARSPMGIHLKQAADACHLAVHELTSSIGSVLNREKLPDVYQNAHHHDLANSVIQLSKNAGLVILKAHDVQNRDWTKAPAVQRRQMMRKALQDALTKAADTAVDLFQSASTAPRPKEGDLGKEALETAVMVATTFRQKLQDSFREHNREDPLPATH